MTKLTRKREFSAKDYVVTLFPNEVVAIRMKRERTEHFTTLKAVYEMAVKNEVQMPELVGMVSRKKYRGD